MVQTDYQERLWDDWCLACGLQWGGQGHDWYVFVVHRHLIPPRYKKKRRKRKHRNKSSEKRAGEKVGQKMRKRNRVLEMSIRF